MKKLNVLSLAWKYHPSITSGVGVACEGFNNALSQITDLTVIYPKVTKVQIHEEVVLDAGNLTEKQKKNIWKEYIEHIKNKEYEVAVSLDPYYTVRKPDRKEVSEIEEEHRESDLPLINSDKIRVHKTTEKFLFEEVDVFGESVKEKIFLYVRLVEELAGKLNFDIIHAHDWMTFAAGIALKNTYNKPLVLHVHSLEYDRVGHKNASWVYDIERHAMSKADKVIAVSEYTKGIIEGSYGLSGDKIETIYNAVSIPEYDVEKRNNSGKVSKILFAGRIDGNKGIEYFIEIGQSVLKYNPNVEFIVVGRGEENVQFEDIEGFNEISSRFKYLGSIERSKLFSLYYECDVLCMPSVSEPFGLTAIEAAHVGLPVVLSNKTGASEILKRTPKTTFWNTEKFASIIVSLLENDSLRERVIANNKKDVATLSWKTSAAQALTIYKQLLN